MVNLNFLKPKIENMILSKTGIPAKIHGNINFTLLGGTTIVAHTLTVPNGSVASCKFTIPFLDIFKLKNTNMSKDISISGASLFIEKITPFEINDTITVHNSNIQFLNKYGIMHKIPPPSISEDGGLHNLFVLNINGRITLRS